MILCIILTIMGTAGALLLYLVHAVKADIVADLSALNLPSVEVYRDLYMQCGDGFFAYVMPWYESRSNPGDLRADAMQAISSAEGWHAEPVTATALNELLMICQTSTPLHPAPDGVYDAWFFRHEGAYPAALPTQRPAGKWTLCFFDQDNGTFITLTDAAILQDASELPLQAFALEGLPLGYVPILQQETPFSLTAFEMPSSLRPDVLQRLSSSLWQASRITCSDFSRQLECMQEEVWPCLYPASEVIFDWCFQQDKLHALYDPDTGLFIYYESDS